MQSARFYFFNISVKPNFLRHRRCLDEDRVMCTYEKPSSSELTSLDPVLVQQTQSSAELTVHLTLSRTESGLATYETVSDCKRECGYDNIETNRKLSSVSEGCSDIQERAPENTVLVSGEKGIQQPPALCDKKEENKDHVYAVVHKERKGRASSEVSALEKTAGHLQEEASGLPVQWASCVDQSPSLTPEDRSSHQTDSGLDTEAAGSETPQAGGNTEYLYAAVDKTKKNKKPPQVIHLTNPDKSFFFVSFCFVLLLFVGFFFLHEDVFLFQHCFIKETILIYLPLRFIMSTYDN